MSVRTPVSLTLAPVVADVAVAWKLLLLLLSVSMVLMLLISAIVSLPFFGTSGYYFHVPVFNLMDKS